MYVYIKSSPKTWTVGFYMNEGERWNPESDHFSEEAAQKQVSYLNGNSRSEVAELKRKLAEVEGERDALRELLSEALEDQRPDHMAVDCKCWVCRAEELYPPAK